MAEARDLFRNKNSTEFVIVTIPTMMAVSESSRLAAALKDDNIPVNKIVVNQVRVCSQEPMRLASICIFSEGLDEYMCISGVI